METPLTTELVQPPAGAPLPALRPLSAGEILDRALQLFRGNFKHLFIVMLSFQAPMHLLLKLATNRSMAALRQVSGGRTGELEPALRDIGTASGLVVATLALYQLALAALTTGAARGYLGHRIEAGPALRDGLKRAPQLVGTFFVQFAWCALLVALAVVPGLAAVAGSFFLSPGTARAALLVGGLVLAVGLQLVVMLYLVLRYALVSEVVVIEKRSFVGALRRSAQLMAGRIGPAFVDNCKVRLSILYAVNFCISMAVLVVTTLPATLVNTAWGVSPFDPERFDPALVPLWASVPVDLLSILVQAAVAPFGLLAVIAFYFDLRIRREGFDLELFASRLGKGA